MKVFNCVKNLLHNDMKVSKKDIDDAITDIVRVRVRKILQDEALISRIVSDEIKKIKQQPYKTPAWRTFFDLRSTFDEKIVEAVAKQVHETIDLEVMPKPPLEPASNDNDCSHKE